MYVIRRVATPTALAAAAATPFVLGEVRAQEDALRRSLESSSDSLQEHGIGTVHVLSSQHSDFWLYCERLRFAWINLRLRAEPTDHVRHRTCADGTVRLPCPSELPGTWSIVHRPGPSGLSRPRLMRCEHTV